MKKKKKDLPENASSAQEPSDLTLEKFLLGELSPEDATHFTRMLSNSPELQVKLEQMKQSGQEILKKYPTEMISKHIRGKLQPRGSKKANIARIIWTLVPVPVVAMLLFTFVPTEERTKGFATGLQIYRKSGDSLERLANGESIRPHDLVQISYSVERRKFGVIVSVDGKKQVTLHWPEKSGLSPSLEPGREVALPSSFELDTSPLYETFILVTADQPFEVEQVLSRAKFGRMEFKTDQFEINLPTGLHQNSITLRKQR